MPVVPNIDINDICCFGHEHRDVDKHTNWNHDCGNWRCPRHSGSCWPSNINNVQSQTITLNHLMGCITKVGRQKTDNQIDADKADTNSNTGLKSLFKPLTKAHANNRNNYWQHNCWTQAKNKLYNL